MVPQKSKIEISFVSKSVITKLNKDYLKRKGATDVLSFNINEKLPDGTFYLGDVLICLEVARKQAEKAGHGLEEEIGELAKHGTKHLLGWDHT